MGQKKQNFSTHLKKCPKSRDDMELKTNYPTADHKYGVQWDKRSRIFQLISKKCPKSTDDMELKTNYPTADHKYGVQWDKRSRIFELISKKYGMQWD